MKITAKILAIYLFIGSFFPRTDFSQLTKIPELVSHYQLHVHEANTLGGTYSIWDFINDHFINPDGHTHPGTDNPHENLPFASVQSVVNFILEQVNTLQFSYTPEFSYTFSFIKKLYSSDFNKSIFHPPSA